MQELVDGFHDFGCRLVNSEYLRYVGSFSLGLIGAYVIQWLSDRRKERRTVRGMREALAQGLIHNLLVLDAYEQTFIAGQADGPNDPTRWPTAALDSAAVERCIDPWSGTLLSEGEQLKLPLIHGQLIDLRDQLQEKYQELRQYPTSRHDIYSSLLNKYLPVIAQNMVDLLCQLFEHQARFTSEHTMAVAQRVLPILSAGPPPDRCWRTSAPGAASNRPSDRLIAWRNDDADQVPVGVEVFEICPREGNYGTIDWHERSWTRRPLTWLSAPLRKREIRRAMAWTPESPPGQHQSD